MPGLVDHVGLAVEPGGRPGLARRSYTVGLPYLLELGERPGQVQPVRRPAQALTLVKRSQDAHWAGGRAQHDPDQLYLTRASAEQHGGPPELRCDLRAAGRAGRVDEAEQYH